MTTKHPKIFLSHSYKDAFIARVVAQRLESLGIETSLDSRDHAGENFKHAIIAAIRESDVVVVLLTPDSIESPYVMAEVGAAFAYGARIIPVFTGMSIDEVREQASFLLPELDEPIPIERFYDEIEDIVLAGSS